MRVWLSKFTGAVNALTTEIKNSIAVLNQGKFNPPLVTGDYDGNKQSVNYVATALHKTMSEVSTSSSQVLSSAKQISSSTMRYLETLQRTRRSGIAHNPRY